MKLNSIALFIMVLAFGLSTTACSKKSSTSNPGRSIDVVPIDTGDGIGDGNVVVDDDFGDVDEVDRGGGDDVVEDTTSTVNPNNILFNNYRYTIPTTKVCTNILQARNAETLMKFFNWNIQSLEGPVTVCIEQEATAQVCPNNESYCDLYPSKQARIRIEYEDDFRFWYYDSAKSTNYAKLLSSTGGSGSNTVQMLLMDGAGFLKVDGFKTSSGAYDVSFSFADRPSYTSARNYDTANSYTSSSPERRAATLYDMKVCAESSNGKFSDGLDCASRFVLHYSFFTTMNTDYSVLENVNTSLWVANQVRLANQYVNNQFPGQFSQYTGYKGGTFGRLLINGL
ncbi:MAG: hypothetical protein R3A80_02895 [Bdellovibrionota bacterium]